MKLNEEILEYIFSNDSYHYYKTVIDNIKKFTLEKVIINKFDYDYYKVSYTILKSRGLTDSGYLIMTKNGIDGKYCNCYDYYYSNLCSHMVMVLIFLESIEFPTKNNTKYINVNIDYSKSDIYKRLNETLVLKYSEYIKKENRYIFSYTLENTKIKKDTTGDQLYLSIDIKNNKIETKIGHQKMYIVKDVLKFISYFANRETIEYGKGNFINHNVEYLDDKSLLIYNFINKCVINELTKENYKIKKIEIANDNINGLYELASQLDSNYSKIIIDNDEDIFVELEVEKDHEYNGIYNVSGTCNIDVLYSPNLYFNENIYEIDNSYIKVYKCDSDGLIAILVELLLHNRVLVFDDEDLKKFYEIYCNDNDIYVNSSELLNYINIDTLKDIKLYATLDEQYRLKLKYTYLFNDVLTNGFDTNSPSHVQLDKIENFIKSYNVDIDYDNNAAYLSLNTKDSHHLITEGLSQLVDYCEVYVDENLKSISKATKVNLNIGVSVSGDLLSLNISSDKITKDDILNVLKSYRHKQKYHKLSNGEILVIDNEEFKDLDEFVKTMNIKDTDLSKNKININKYRALSLDNLEYQNMMVNKDKLYNKFLENYNNYKELNINDFYQNTLKDYQKVGVNWLNRIKSYGLGGILADDMGLGKTIQVMALVEHTHQKNQKHLVISPASLLYNWQEELEKFNFSLKFKCILGNQVQRDEIYDDIDSYDFYITSYDYLKRDIHKLESIEFENIFLDEAQYIKNNKTKATRATKLLKGKTKFALTGTPIENTLAELWSIFDFIMPSYLYTYSSFKKDYEISIVRRNNKDVKKKLKTLVEPFILRRTKQEVLDLPDKIETTIKYSFTNDEKKLYLTYLAMVNKELGEKFEVNQANRMMVLSLLTKLRQICCEPRILFDNISNPSSKLNGCIALIKELLSKDKPILIFSSFTTVLDLIEEQLKLNNISYDKLTGQTTKIKRKNLVESFQNDEFKVMLISLKAGGTGLNLTKAQAVIHYDPWWNVSAQNQATDRAYRIGQANNVDVYKLVMSESIEEKIVSLQEKKFELANEFISNSDNLIGNLVFDDLIDLLKN